METNGKQSDEVAQAQDVNSVNSVISRSLGGVQY